LECRADGIQEYDGVKYVVLDPLAVDGSNNSVEELRPKGIFRL